MTTCSRRARSPASPVRRVEDPSLLRGAGTYVDNLHVDGMLVVAVRALADGARADPFHRRERRRARCPESSASTPPTTSTFPAAPAFMLLHPDTGHNALAQGRVNFVGDPVAVVVAETRAQAVDAARARRRRLRAAPTLPSTWKLHSRPTRRCSSSRSARTSSCGMQPGNRRRARGCRCRRARPLREPARRGGADGGQRDRGRPRTTATSTSWCTSRARCRT